MGGLGGVVGSPLGEPADVPPTANSAVGCEATEGAVGDPPHHADASAHTTDKVRPSFRGELGDKFRTSVPCRSGTIDRRLVYIGF